MQASLEDLSLVLGEVAIFRGLPAAVTAEVARSVQETLQRYAIVLTRVLAQPRIEAEQLEADGLMMAERLGTLHGINAPEFFDQKLFSTLIHTLRSEGYLDTGCKPDLGRFQALADNIVPLLSNKIRRTIQAGNRL